MHIAPPQDTSRSLPPTYSSVPLRTHSSGSAPQADGPWIASSTSSLVMLRPSPPIQRWYEGDVVDLGARRRSGGGAAALRVGARRHRARRAAPRVLRHGVGGTRFHWPRRYSRKKSERARSSIWPSGFAQPARDLGRVSMHA